MVAVVAMVLGPRAHAAVVIGAGGKPVRSGTGRALLIASANDGACRAPPDQRVVTFNLAPETKLADAISWIASVTCKSFLVPDTIIAENRRLTMVAPELITPDEAYRLFTVALDSIGLMIEPSGRFRRIVEGGTGFLLTVKNGTVHMRSVVEEEPYVTVLVRLHDVAPADRARLFELVQPLNGEACDCAVSRPDTVFITNLRSTIERVLHRPIGR